MFANHSATFFAPAHSDVVRVIRDDFREVCERRQVVEVCITELVLFLDRLCRLAIRFASASWSRSGRDASPPIVPNGANEFVLILIVAMSLSFSIFRLGCISSGHSGRADQEAP